MNILVNDAGVGAPYRATRDTREQFRQVIDINLNGLLLDWPRLWVRESAASSIVNVNRVLGMTTAGLRKPRLRRPRQG